MNRKERRAAQAKGEQPFDTSAFLRTADKFIDLANKENQTVQATDLHMAFLYAASRYNAHVAKNVVDVSDQEKFVDEMTKNYAEMLRNHLADPNV